MTHTHNLSYLEGGDPEDCDWRPAEQKLARPHLNKKAGCGGIYICNPSCAGCISKRIMVQASLGKKCEILSKK
jgi:hypothetical protein